MEVSARKMFLEPLGSKTRRAAYRTILLGLSKFVRMHSGHEWLYGIRLDVYTLVTSQARL